MAIGFPLHALRFNAGLYFLADVLCVPLRHDVDKGRKPCHSSWRDDYLSVFHRSNYTIELSTKNGANSCVRETENNQ